jgi:hypothetical protein
MSVLIAASRQTDDSVACRVEQPETPTFKVEVEYVEVDVRATD